MGMYVYICVSLGTCACMGSMRMCMSIQYACIVCDCVSVSLHVSLYVCYSCTRDRSRVYRRPGPDLDSCSQSSYTPGDLKTDIRDDLEIRTDSCNAEQTTIRAQNHIISCECLFLCYFLIYYCQ